VDQTPNQPDLPQWYALSVRVRSELLVADGLNCRGFEPYVPLSPRRRCYSERVKNVLEVVFSGYVFCRFDVRHKVQVISIPGVHNIVAFCGVPTPLCATDIDHLKTMVACGAYQVPYLSKGQRVRVEYGALAGVEGILTRDQDSRRLIVSIDLLQRSVSLYIPADRVSVIH
jgi:transcription antitermination factor NusG